MEVDIDTQTIWNWTILNGITAAISGTVGTLSGYYTVVWYPTAIASSITFPATFASYYLVTYLVDQVGNSTLSEWSRVIAASTALFVFFALPLGMEAKIEVVLLATAIGVTSTYYLLNYLVRREPVE